MKGLRQSPLHICSDCGEHSDVMNCVGCSRPVCPKHRAGLGSVSDGYSCGDCLAHSFGFGGYAKNIDPLHVRAKSALARIIGAPPWWVWGIIALLIGYFGRDIVAFMKGTP